MRVAHRGLAVITPSGWDARIYQRTADTKGEVTRPILHAADFALPNVRGDYGSGVVEVMAPDKVFLSLIEFDSAEATTPLFSNPRPSRITAGEFGPNQLQRGIPGQAGAQFFFSERGRAFCLYVVIGSYEQRTALVARANQIFQGMEIS
ncbi:MAG: hypothetical protein JWN96_3293 [Mycobacterium sp.]|jgi:hypothetical protein|nr:hypothetical protein [Mycobacterium sp.]